MEQRHYRYAALAFAMVVFFSASPLLADSAFDPLVILSGDGMGQLVYNPADGRYELQDAQIHTFFLEGNSFQEQKRGHQGGTLAIPSTLGSMKGALFAMFSSYNAIGRFDAGFSLLQKAQFGPFEYTGSFPRYMQVYDGTIFFYKDGAVIAWDDQLREKGRLKVPNETNLNQFIIADHKLYFLAEVNTRPASDCEGGNSCGQRYLFSAIVDVADPAHMKLLSSQSLAQDIPSGTFLFKAVDPSQQQGLMIVTNWKNSIALEQIEIRSLNDLGKVVAAKDVSQLVGMTSVAPFWAVVAQDKSLFLLPIRVEKNSISFGDKVDLGLSVVPSVGEVKIKQNGDRLYIALAHHLRVVNVTSAPRVELSQEFQDNSGIQFSIDDFEFSTVTPKASPDGTVGASPGVDRQNFLALLRLDYYGPEDIRILNNEIAKLSPQDGWAVPFLSDLLHKAGGSAFVIHPMIAQALGNIGPASQPAIAALLDASMQAAAVRGDYLGPLVQALKKIDPGTEKIITELESFEQRKYKPSARYISKQILSQMQTDAARQALKRYP